jgi:hypothetical protein
VWFFYPADLPAIIQLLNYSVFSVIGICQEFVILWLKSLLFLKMKTKSFILIIGLLLMMPGMSSAQFGAIRKAINKQIDHKIDSTLEKNAQDHRDKQAQEGNQQNKPDAAGASENPPQRNKNIGLFGGKIDIKYKDNYDFTGRIYMQMETYDKKDVIKSDFYTYYNENNKDAGVDLRTVDPNDNSKLITTSFIIDQENRAMMSLFGGDTRIGTISALPSDSALAAQVQTTGENKKQPVVTKTGRSRAIAGYPCDEYKVVDPDVSGYSLVWMTKEFKVKSDTRYWGKSGMPNYYNYPGFKGMVMLAMEEYDKNDKLNIKMETVEINEHFKHSISTEGYTFTKVNIPQGRAGKK